jgi:hypothetical protein
MSKNISFDDGAESVASSAKEHGVANNSTVVERETLARKEDALNIRLMPMPLKGPNLRRRIWIRSQVDETARI